MATLTETAYYTRRTINWIILAIVMYIILRLSWALIVAIWFTIFPPKPPPPNHRFGKLPAIAFPRQGTPSAQLTFRLETIEGTIPKASDSAAVYFMPKAAANLLALTRTQDFAERFGFDPTPIVDTKNIYRFNDPELPLRRLRYDIVSNNFIIRYGFELDTGLFNERLLPSVDAAKAEAVSTLQSFKLYHADLARGTSKMTFLKLVGDKLAVTTSLSQADAVRVDFFRGGIGNIPIFPPSPDEGLVSFIFSGARNAKKKLLQLAYTLWPIDYQTFGTYALTTGGQAWQELQSGGGYIARYPRSGTTAIVRQVYLAYYDSFEPQTYLQPIFVFEGDYGFMAFVPAVVKEWIEEGG